MWELYMWWAGSFAEQNLGQRFVDHWQTLNHSEENLKRCEP